MKYLSREDVYLGWNFVIYLDTTKQIMIVCLKYEQYDNMCSECKIYVLFRG